MKWREELTRDIRFGDDRDYIDECYDFRNASAEFSECNSNALKSAFMSIRDKAKLIVEIGVHRNGQESSTCVFLDNKLPETLYVGIDIADKKFLDNPGKNIHTIINKSERVFDNMNEIARLTGQSIDEVVIDFLMIDGFHSINQMLVDWEYTRAVKSGVIGVHDSNRHPGPSRFTKYLDRTKYDVQKCCGAIDDNGISFIKRISN
jgi:hypothetical protein